MFRVPPRLRTILNPNLGFNDGSFWMNTKDERDAILRGIAALAPGVNNEIEGSLRQLIKAIFLHEEQVLLPRHIAQLLCDVGNLRRGLVGTLIKKSYNELEKTDMWSIAFGDKQLMIFASVLEMLPFQPPDPFNLSEDEHGRVFSLAHNFLNNSDTDIFRHISEARSYGLLSALFAEYLKSDPEKIEKIVTTFYVGPNKQEFWQNYEIAKAHVSNESVISQSFCNNTRRIESSWQRKRRLL